MWRLWSRSEKYAFTTRSPGDSPTGSLQTTCLQGEFRWQIPFLWFLTSPSVSGGKRELHCYLAVLASALLPASPGFLFFSNNFWTVWAPKQIRSSFESLASQHMLRVHVLALFIWVPAGCYAYKRSSTNVYWLFLYYVNFRLVLFNLYVQFSSTRLWDA